jgi:UDP-N-acetylmuramoyl-tripeptide--D-alanyl-D-alanine ligase
VVIDGRAAQAGALFFCIEGERFDGHDFAAQAAAQGATGVVCARGRGAGLGVQAAIIEVDDTIAALGKLAHAHRAAMKGLRVVGVAGSNGKTTTKEMIAAICVAAADEAAVCKTGGNLNNHLGVPLTLLRLSESHRYAVVEMGMSALGELAHLTALTEPQVGVVVSIAVEHLEHLGTLENVAQAEAEILMGLPPHGVGVVPSDEPLLAPWAARLPRERLVTFGPAGADAHASGVTQDARGLSFTLHLRGASHAVRMPLVGAHNARNAAAAAAVATAIGLDAQAIVAGLAQVEPAKHRGQLVPLGERLILDDCYNASPISMRAALDTLTAIAGPGRRRIAVLGDMLELGPDEGAMHAEVGAYTAGRTDELVAFGPRARGLAAAAQAGLGASHVTHTDDAGAAIARVLDVMGADAVILVKGSRGMKLERVIDGLVARLGGG